MGYAKLLDLLRECLPRPFARGKRRELFAAGATTN
jgi:hypothetical protein